MVIRDLISIFLFISLVGYAVTSFLEVINFFFKKDLSPWTRKTLFFSWLTHSISLGLFIFQIKRLPFNNLAETLSIFIWGIVFMLFLLQSKEKLKNIGLFIIPFVTLAMFYLLFFLKSSKIYTFDSLLFLGFHVFVILFSFIFITLSFSFTIIYLIQEFFLKKKKLISTSEKLPSLELMETLSHRFASLGFFFLTLGIISGAIWSERTWGSYWFWQPKQIFTLLLWLVYVLYFHLRIIRGWRGHKTAYLLIFAFFLLLFTYLGVNCLGKGWHSFI